MNKKKLTILLGTMGLLCLLVSGHANPPVYIAFLWHMHQPIYWPGETVNETYSAGHYSYDLYDIFRQRTGPYTSWPIDAVEAGKNAGFGHFGAQVSFSGSLAENLDNLKGVVSDYNSWENRWVEGRQWQTSLGNPRLDIIGFGYYHALNGLIDYNSIRKQIQMHKKSVGDNFGSSVPYSKGYFPAETAFSPRMIPALLDEGMEWVIVDNIHFDRACQGYPWNSGGNLYEPNPADQQNPNPGDWVSLSGLWAPTQVSAQWGHQPHYVSYTDPSTGTVRKIIAVPGDRYMGNEDARGGFGALNYETVMSQLEAYNTDTAHPILIVLHHDGDNYGGGSDSYYHSNFNNFISWLQSNPSRFVCTTIQDYLDLYPPDTTDIIHIEDGSWSGADNGDPEFKKWNGDPDSEGYSPDRNSWGVMMAAENRVNTANQISPTDSRSSVARKWMLEGQTSCYWYWEPNSTTWDGHPTRAANLAAVQANAVIGSGALDSTGPSIYVPQREPYNPGGNEWGIAQSTSFSVWSYVYDLSGLASVNLKYRTDLDGTVGNDNQTYAGGAGVSAWTTISMSSIYHTPETSVAPSYKAYEYYATISGVTGKLYDYYIEATDTKGNVSRSDIRHVKEGTLSSGGGTEPGDICFWQPSTPTTSHTLSVYYDPVKGSLPDTATTVYLHWGYNYWATVISPNPSMSYDSSTGYYRYDLTVPSTATTVDFVFTDGTNWDNNGAKDWHVGVYSQSTATAYQYQLDGSLDTVAQKIASSSDSTLNLWAHWNGTKLYLATEKAAGGNDRFIILVQNPSILTTAFWAKSGQVTKWDAFIGNEESNSWSGWFNFAGSVSGWSYALTATGGGGYLEGTIELASLYGSVPSSVYLAAVGYGSADGGSLQVQAPVGNGNGNLETTELVQYVLETPITLVDYWIEIGE
jgi:hypothetical protein